MKRSPSVEEIQDMVENQIMSQRAFNVARNYITYRYKRELVRKSNSTDEQILSLLECNNEEVKQENSNKNPTVNSVQRDYMAGEVSKDITRRFLLPPDIVEAHENGLIHFHDADYFAQHMHNCCLVNLEDMLQNGTVISETMIDPPKSFSTACNVATQAIAQIASSQYGGQSISLSHLAPFVQVSREKFRKQVKMELEAAGIEPTEDKVNKIAELRVKEEINRGVQMIQYQVITLMTTNGQAPFITVFMYLSEVPEGQLRDDEPCVAGIGDLNFSVLIPGGIGAVATVLLFAKAVDTLFKKHYSVAFHAIVGVVIAATIMIIPVGGFTASAADAFLNTFCLLVGVVAAVLLDKFNQKYAVK